MNLILFMQQLPVSAAKSEYLKRNESVLEEQDLSCTSINVGEEQRKLQLRAFF